MRLLNLHRKGLAMAWVKTLTICVPQHLLSPTFCLFSPWVTFAFKSAVLSDGQTHCLAVQPISNLPNHSHSRSCVLSWYRAKGEITFLVKICVTLLQSLWVTFEDHFHFPPFCGVFLFGGVVTFSAGTLHLMTQISFYRFFSSGPFAWVWSKINLEKLGNLLSSFSTKSCNM